MAKRTVNYIRALAIIILLAVIITGSLAAWSRYRPTQPLEITLRTQPALSGEVYISGAVNNPGFYPLRAEDSVSDIVRAAGGLTADAAANEFRLSIPQQTAAQPQKVDINHAEAWLLEALPGIGEVRAKAIIAYRQQHDKFRSTAELMNVEGIGTAAYEQIKDLVTVSE